MLKNRLISVYNRSRKQTGFPEIEVIVNDSDWTVPPGVHKDKSLDGWYDDQGNEVDESTFWKTVSIDVAIGEQKVVGVLTETDGIVLQQELSFFTLYSKERFNQLMNAYGFLVNSIRYSLSSIRLLPTPTDPSVIEFSLRLWSEEYNR